MKTEFIQDVIENEDLPRFLQRLTGWEAVVFELEDDSDEVRPVRPVRPVRARIE